MPGANQPLFSHFNIKVNGSQAPSDLSEQVEEIRIENSLHLPDMCTIHVIDNAFEWLDKDTFKVGAEVEVESGYETTNESGASEMTSVFYGEVTSLEVDMDTEKDVVFFVHCLDKSHRLHRGRQSRTFVNVTDSDIVSQLASEAGLTAATDATSEVHDWVMQNNQTNWEFLIERAGRASRRLYVQGQRELHFKKVKNEGEATISLSWGDNLISFRPHVAAGHQVDTVEVRGWNRKTKEAIIGQATTPNGIPQVGGPNDGGAVTQAAFSSAKMVVTDHPIFSQSEADTLAQSVRDDIGGNFLEAEGTCLGDPHLKPGVAVEIKNIGTKYSGKYVLSSTVHTYSTNGYLTDFTISGKSASSLHSVLHSDNGGTRAPMGGNIVVGVVTQNKDPDSSLGRVKVKYPWLTDQHESDWAPIAVPMAGPGRGFFFLPEINDEVLVAFEHGDVRRPYVIGCLWNGVDNPMQKNSEVLDGSDVAKRIIKTRIGHTILLDDTGGQGEMNLTSKYGHVLTLNDKDKKIMGKTKEGHTITLDDQNSNIVIVDKTGSNKMTINSNDNSIALECAGDYKVTAQGQVTIQGQMGIQMSTPAQFSASADAGMTLSSEATMSVSANATMSISSDGPMSISSDAIVSINA